MTGSLREFSITNHRLMPTVGVRTVVPFAELDLGALIPATLEVVVPHLAEHGPPPAGPPYVRYHAFGPEAADVEIGVPVATSALVLPEPLQMFDLPPGPVATVTHFGPYMTLPEAVGALNEWIVDQGHTPAAGNWESYVDDPASVDDVNGVRTELFWPLG